MSKPRHPLIYTIVYAIVSAILASLGTGAVAVDQGRKTVRWVKWRERIRCRRLLGYEGQEQLLLDTPQPPLLVRLFDPMDCADDPVPPQRHRQAVSEDYFNGGHSCR